MTIIESIGMPCSGKTRNYLIIKKKLKKKKKFIYNYSELFFIYSDKIINLSFFEKLALKVVYRIYKNNQKSNYLLSSKHKKKQPNIVNYIKFKVKCYVYYKSNLVKKKIIKNFNTTEKKLYSILKKSVNSSPLNYRDKLILMQRVEEEIIGLSIYKKYKLDKFIILNDEGIIQRILSGIKNKKKIPVYLNFFYKFFNIDIILFNNSKYDELIKRSIKRRYGFNYNQLNKNNIQQWINIFDDFFSKYNNKGKFKIERNVSSIVNIIDQIP